MQGGIEFSHYRVIEHIGRGGMADVWSARDKRLNRTVAVKTIARQLSAITDPVQLFEREAKTIARLEHPHILPIYDFGEYGGQLYIVMRYLAGGSLQALLEQGALAYDDAIRLVRPIAQALDYAHANHVIHLDIKPSNILLDSTGSPYLADFGLASVLNPDGRALNPGSGTLLYMAPEQMTSFVLDQRADVYSFCVLIFHMLTGQLPFDGVTSLALRQIHEHVDLPDAHTLQLQLPVEVSAILRSGTLIDIERRTGSIMEVFAALEALSAPLSSSTTQTGARISVASGDRSTDVDVNHLRVVTLKLTSFDALDKTVALPPKRPVSPDVTEPGDGLPDNDLPAHHLERRDAELLYTRARRAWAGGQGRFLLGATPFMLMHDFYVRADENDLTTDAYGMQMLLRGALEYATDTQPWSVKLDDDSRRLVALHALRSDNPGARARALIQLETVADTIKGDKQTVPLVPTIPAAILLLLQTERDGMVRLAALEALQVRGQLPESTVDRPRWARLENPPALAAWREIVFAPTLDQRLADFALDHTPRFAENAARTIGHIRSVSAVRHIASKQGQAARRALALIRDEAPSLPTDISAAARFNAWLSNTLRRLREHPLALVSRFLWAVVGGWLAMGLYVALETPGLPLFDPNRFSLILSVGLTFGVIFGLQVVAASELPSRLRGFWQAGARGVFSAIMGFIVGALGWAVFTWLFLQFVAEANVLIVGVGTAVGFAIPVMIRLPAWASVIVTAAGVGISLYVAQIIQTPILYILDDQNPAAVIFIVALILGIGAYAQALWREWMGRR